MKDARRAEIWCWLTWFYSQEADTILYNPSRTEEDEKVAEQLQEAAEACYQRASSIDPNPDLWERSMISWADTPVQPC